jgi:hypothetical protein
VLDDHDERWNNHCSNDDHSADDDFDDQHNVFEEAEEAEEAEDPAHHASPQQR